MMLKIYQYGMQKYDIFRNQKIFFENYF